MRRWEEKGTYLKLGGERTITKRVIKGHCLRSGECRGRGGRLKERKALRKARSQKMGPGGVKSGRKKSRRGTK